MYKTYRLWFSQQRIISNGAGSSGTVLKEPRPTTILFRAQSQEEADNKAHKFISQCGLIGVYNTKLTRGTGQ